MTLSKTHKNIEKIMRTFVIIMGVGLIGYVHGQMIWYQALILYISGAFFVGGGLYSK